MTEPQAPKHTALLPVRVKALRWESEDERARAKSVIGEYVVGKVGITFGWVNNGLTGWHSAVSFEAAKASAEADYERRILSALVGGCDAPNT